MWPWGQGERKKATSGWKFPRETPPVITVSVLFRQPSFLCHSRHRSCISGWSLRYAWRMWLALSCCLQVENESLAPPVTLVSITMTLPPAHHAQLGPILMEWNVLRTLNDIVYTHFSLVTLSVCPVWLSKCCLHCPLSAACKQCPAGTEPTLGYEYKWWNVLPANMKTSCFNVGNSKCDKMNGWYFYISV